MNRTVLCVEDEEDYQLLLRRILGRARLLVSTVETGAQGLALLRERKPGAILLDINLPDMSGYDFCAQARKDYGAEELPIIMLTVRRRPEEWLHGFSCGASDYIAKPLNPAQLLDRVLYHLEENTCPWNGPMSAEYKLIQAAVAGNRSAFDVLIQKYRKRLVESLGSAIRNETHLEDVISHTLETALDRLPEFRGEAGFFTWIYRIAMNEYMAAYRKPLPLSLEALLETKAEQILPLLDQQEPEENMLAAKEMGQQALETLGQIPQPYRKVLELYCLKGLSYEHIARKMRIPEGTVMSRLHKARKLLQGAWTKTPASLIQ